MRSLLGVLNIFGSLLTWFALYFVLPIVTALLYGELAPLRGFIAGAGIAIVGGLLLRLATQRYRYDLKSRDAYLLVTSTVLLVAAVAAVLKDGAMPQQVIDAAEVIEAAGFTVIDDLLHGYGGGYLPPILGSRSRPSAHVPNEPFRAGMVVVIQPNVVTSDGSAGVQTGEMVLVTKDGIETFHTIPRGFMRV